MEKALDQLGLELITDLFLEVLISRKRLCSGSLCGQGIERIIPKSLVLRNNKNVVPAEVLLTILRNYTENLIKDADVLFKTVKNKVKPGANTYNVLFFRCCRVRNPTREMKVLKEMIQLGLLPCNFTCITSIVTLCRAGEVTKAADLSVFMRTKDSTMSSLTAKT
ncbi:PENTATRICOPEPTIDE REPEAT-CONTAINING PROTEIN 3 MITOCHONDRIAL [Salix purpurea]|uniref:PENTATRICOPEPTIDE REPEAT-CONTAINING PROTEIN 3 MITOCHONDRIAL n=1 Tax=Salix purpurea TaxID=77065 RepID=A0A9Q0Z9E0_SALPP|nr:PENTATRICOPEPTIDE REPEAT-CONTAINING PROTEIN 3 MITOCHONDRIAL [Salix purpurea]